MYGKAIVYETNDAEEQLAFITSTGGGHTVDLLAFDKNGAGSHHKDVPQREEGGGHTWRFAK